MRLIIASVLSLVAFGSGAVGIEARDVEKRVIANAAYLLTSAAYKPQNKLSIISPDKATLTSPGLSVVKIEQTAACVFEMIEPRSYGMKIDFNKLGGSYRETVETTFGRAEIKLVVDGLDGASCETRPSGSNTLLLCRPWLRFNSRPEQFAELLASLRFIQEHGCPAYEPPAVKPRF